MSKPSAAPRSAIPQRAALHIFCEHTATAAAAAHALADRRLAALKSAQHMGGLEAARVAYAEAATPDLIVVETAAGADGMLADLERLAEVCDAGTKVIVIGGANDVLLYRELLRRGISDYLVAPPDVRQLADSIAAALTDGAADAPGRAIAFIGAKGGCGSSTVCHNTAWVLAEQMAAETVIADFDLAFGTLGLDFNQDGPRGLGDALAAGDRLDAAMMAKLISKCSDRLGLLTPPCDLEGAGEIGAEAVARLAALLPSVAAFVMLDLPRDWRAATRQVLLSADEVVITAEPDLANLRNAKLLIDAVRALRGPEASPILVLNRAELPRRPEIAVRDFANAVDLQPAAVIGFDAQLFGTAANNGLMIGEVAPKARQLELFRQLAGLLQGETMPVRAQSGLIGPLVARLGRKLAR
jgi:pilus assembly protein CpaE